MMMQSTIHVYEMLSAIAQAYIPGGPRPIGKLTGLLLPAAGFLVALLLIWMALRWVIQKRRK